MMLDFFGSLEPAQSASFSAWATIVVAAFSIVTVIVSLVVVRENRLLRRAGNSPAIVGYLMPHPEGHGGINFVIENVGTGPAFNVRFEMSGNRTEFKLHGVTIREADDRAPFGVIPQHGKITALFGIGHVLYGGSDSTLESPLRPFDAIFNFEDFLGRKHQSKSRIDITQFSGLGLNSKPPIARMADSMEQIENHLSIISQRSSTFVSWVNSSEIRDKRIRKIKGSE